MNRQKDFYPDYLVEILVIAFLIAELVVVLSLLFPQNVGRPIDFAMPFRPKPEWYFLWLYQLIQYFPGKTILIGTTFIPFTAVLAVILIPFIDKGKYGRFKAVVAGMTVLFSFILFTFIALLNP